MTRAVTAAPGRPERLGGWGAMSGPPITLGACRSIEGCHGFAGAPRACGGYGGPFGAPHVTRVCSGGGGGAPLARPVDAEPAVPQVRRAVRRRGLVGAADQRPPRDLLHVQGVARAARADPAREGQRRRADDRALRARDRAPDGLDDAAAGGAGPRRARAAADRLRPATAPGARHHRGRLPRRARARAAARLPAGHGRGGRRRRRLQRAALPRDARRTRLVRARVLPQGLGAVHDARRAPRLLRHVAGHRGRDQPQVHLGRRLADPRGSPGPGLRGRSAGAPHRASLTGRWRKLGFDLHFGIGVAQGYATLGAIGFEGRWDYGAIGTVTNLAARLCGEARGGQILVSRRLYTSVEDLVEVEPLGELTLRGV